ncbi:hypothetical protein ACFRAR_08150 [Kitasatospora sp. NPDC056651]|uniref:hypothetical protein n=1 Tax=Kitasatospora sp. NPDC056651 TaxID=3345892 RepID=UPI0036B53747
MAPRHLAGWLFADLFLVLMLLAFGATTPEKPDDSAADGAPSGAPSGSASASGAPTASEPPTGSGSPTASGPSGSGLTSMGLDPRSVTVTVVVGSGPVRSGSLPETVAGTVLGEVGAAVEKDGARRGVGLVITSGLAPTAGQGPAQQLAAAVNTVLQSRLRSAFCGQSDQQVVLRDAWRGASTSDSVQVELFFVNGCRRQ